MKDEIDTPLENTQNKAFYSSTLNKVKTYVKNNPKKAFKIMIALVTISLIVNVARIIYTETIIVPRYEEMAKGKIFKEGNNSFSEPIETAQSIFEKKKVLDELEYYQTKPTLTTADSLRINYLLDKNLNNEKK